MKMKTRVMIDKKVLNNLVKAKPSEKYPNAYYLNKEVNSGKHYNLVIFYNLEERPKPYTTYLIAFVHNAKLDKNIITIVRKLNQMPNYFLLLTEEIREGDLIVAKGEQSLVLRDFVDTILEDGGNADKIYIPF